MRASSLIAMAVLAIGLCLPVAASAQVYAYAAPGTTNVRAGPGISYAVIGKVYGGTPINVIGCLADRSWCEVVIDDTIRGWMAASRLQFVYQGRWVYVPDYYGYFAAPIIRFRFDRDYRRRPPVEKPVTPPCPLPWPNCLPLGGDQPGDRGPSGGWEPDYPPAGASGTPPPSAAQSGSAGVGEARVPRSNRVCPPNDPNCY